MMSRTASVLILSVWAAVAVQVRAGNPGEPVPMPHPIPPGAQAVEAPQDAGCVGGGGSVRSCLTHLAAWLCYRPSGSDCKCPPAPCCRPQLHAFFLHRCAACSHDHYDGEVIPVYFSVTTLAPCIGSGPG